MHTGALWFLGLAALAIDAFVWGVAAHVLYRAFAGATERWLGPAVIAGLVFVVWDRWLFAALVGMGGIPSSRGALGPGWLLEVGLGVGTTVAGSWLSRVILNRILRHSGR